mgnify:FL=1
MFISFNKITKKYNLEIKGVAHFGAHKGQEVKSYLENNIKNIHLFEPQAHAFNYLKNNYEFSDEITLYNFGLGHQEKKVDLFKEKVNDGMSSSILQPLKHKKYYPDILFEEKEQILIKRYEDLNIKNVNFLNIDIQGFELEALKGCGNKLHEVDYIYTEINRKELYRGNHHVREIDKYLKQFNFLRVQTVWASSFLPFGDALYLKKINITKSRLFLSVIKIILWSSGLFYIYIDIARPIKKLLIKTRNFFKTIV